MCKIATLNYSMGLVSSFTLVAHCCTSTQWIAQTIRGDIMLNPKEKFNVAILHMERPQIDWYWFYYNHCGGKGQDKNVPISLQRALKRSPTGYEVVLNRPNRRD